MEGNSGDVTLIQYVTAFGRADAGRAPVRSDEKFFCLGSERSTELMPSQVEDMCIHSLEI